ncbi:MAG: T9SS type A sorting domain-containing protein [Flavobacteriales bacterium]|jgi:hypothetical protein|nr:T9SS type A sorting domain-containing protein [Flavobacteriales bacterium]
MGTTLRAFLIAGLFGQVTLSLHAQQLLDDFNRPANTVVGGGWTEVEPSTGQAQVNASGQLVIGAGTPAGRTYVVQDMTGFYGTVLNTNSCMLTWAFNVRQTRTDPSGFNAGAYGAAFVLGATGSNLTTGTTGYAVVFGQSGTADPLRLVRFSNGLASDAVLNNVITAGATPTPFNDLSTHYLAVRVTYVPGTGTWTMYATNLSLSTFSTYDPLNATTQVGTATVNNTYTGNDLRYIGCVWNHSTGTTENALFENINIPQLCIPTVNLNTASTLAPENIGSTITVTMGIFPATLTGGNIVVTVTNGVGVVYGTDYTTLPAVAGSDITIAVPPGATTASFTITLVNDAVDENNEQVTFDLTSTTNDLVLGTDLTHVLTVIDDDGPPEVNFTTLSHTVLETGGGSVVFSLSINPPAPAAGNITFSVTPGVGAVCGVGMDYQVQGFACPTPTFTVPVAIGATTLSFTVNYYDDVMNMEPTEDVTFTVTNTPWGVGGVGAANAGVLYIADNDSPATVLGPGDIAIVGVNANNGACPGGSTGDDFVSFFCFKPIQYNTRIIITDNGYERCSPGLWGNSEGTVEIRRTGPMIPAGQVITLRFTNSSGAGNVLGVAPDASWTCTSLNGGTTLALNVGGDQMFFMQGGTWTTNTVGGHDATYSGAISYGFSTNPSPPWSATCLSPAGNQRSNLPPGMNCFSMSPTLASDFNKYIGPLTLASQRDWIIRLDNTANWNSYGSCGVYNATSPIWLLSPTLPIVPGTPVPGLWRGSGGAGGTDWFDCKNWDDAVVPTATTIVVINEQANNNCVVGITAGGTAVCAALVQTNAGTPRNLTVQNTSSLAVGGPINVQRTSTGTPIALTVTGGSTLTATNFTIQGTVPNEAILRNEVNTNTVSFSGDLTINPGGLVDLQGAGTGGTISIAGNYQNLGPDQSSLEETYGTLRFNGMGSQNINTSGFEEEFHNLTLNKPSGSLNLNSDIAVKNILDLTNGLLNTTGTEILTMRAGSSVANASNNSFVNGPMVKVGITPFRFPVGKGAYLRPIEVSSIAGTGTDAFRAEYFPVNPSFFGTTGDPTLHHISTCEYWTLDRASGTPNAVVSLTWDSPSSCGVSNLSELRVARWDDVALPPPGTWRDRGNGGATGTFISGTIPTAAVQSVFNATLTPWTLASTTANNPLPITLLNFDAQPEGTMVRLNWATATEQDNALFTVERSRDGIVFEEVLNVPGAMNSNTLITYSELDRAPYPGLSYYRLRQTDTDGTSTYSNMVAVLFGGVSERPLVIFGNGENWTAIHSFAAGSTYELVDMTGRRVLGGRTAMEGRTDLYGVELSRGAYVFRITDGERMESQRFVH